MQPDQLTKREVIVLLGGAAATWPLSVQAQSKVRSIGYLGSGSLSAQGPWIAAFVQRLRELGWIEGVTFAVEHRWAEGRSERYAEIAAEFVRQNVAVILTEGVAVPAAMRATATTPIVFAVAGDPVGAGLVASLARPGGNVTGLSIQQPELAGKRLELIREVVPGLRRVAVLANIGSNNVALEMVEVQTAARTLGLEIAWMEVRQASDIAAAFDSLSGRADALYVCGDPLVNANRVQINTLALGARLPTIHGFREFAEAGALMTYGPNFPDMFRRAGEIVDKILRGAKPADMPVEQPTKFDLVINLTTAKTLGLAFSPSLLARANQVIE
jgi:putative ABC transport system substrate-binding protein